MTDTPALSGRADEHEYDDAVDAYLDRLDVEDPEPTPTFAEMSAMVGLPNGAK